MADVYMDCCSEAHGGLAVLASSVIGVGAEWPRSCAGRVRVTMRDTDTVPGAIAACPDCRARTFDEQAGDQRTAPWLAHAQTPAWTGAEKGVLVPEPDGTAAIVAAAAATWPVTGGWEVCERLTLATDTTVGGTPYAAGVYRIVRYTGTRPAELGAYRVLYADGVAEAVALAEPVGGV